MKFRSIFWALFALLLSANSLFGQLGYSSASMGKSRAGMLPSLQNIQIEEFFNYHDHRLALPEDGQRVNLDLRWNRVSKKDAVIQIGLATPRKLAPESLPPLNLVLVIDQSGSMKTDDRIGKVREAILAFVEGLRKDDLVTIVGFNDHARVHLEACRKTSQEKIVKALKSIHATGFTNLHAGLMLGYQEAEKNFDAKRSNRVILLSDGITNRGETNSEKIAKQSKAFNKKNIDLSTIGLGHDFNENLLRELAEAGRGLIHFVGDSKDIKKTFINELDSLLAPAARKVKMEIDFGSAASDARIYGYKPIRKGNLQNLKLDNLNCGTTQVVMARIDDYQEHSRVRVKLSYVDAVNGKSVELTEIVDFSEVGETPVLTDRDLKKNYAITHLAYRIEQCLEIAEQKKYSKAIKKLRKGIDFARDHYSKGRDKDVDRLLKIAKKYEEKLVVYQKAHEKHQQNEGHE